MYYLRVSEEEYDFFCENGSDEELDMVVDGTVECSTFAQKRLCLEVIRKYVGLYMDIQEGKDEKYSFEWTFHITVGYLRRLLEDTFNRSKMFIAAFANTVLQAVRCLQINVPTKNNSSLN